MKPLIAFCLLLASYTSCLAQSSVEEDKYRSQLTNAYTVTRELVKMDKKIRQLPAGGKLSLADSAKAKILFSALTWYADLQDEPEESINVKLSLKLGNGYPFLNKIYLNMVPQLYNLKLLVVENEDTAIARATAALSLSVNKLSEDPGYRAYVNEMSPYWNKITSLQQLTDKRNKKTVELLAYRLRVADTANTIRECLHNLFNASQGTDTAKLQASIASEVNKFRDDSLNLEQDLSKTIESVNKMTNEIVEMKASLLRKFLTPNSLPENLKNFFTRLSLLANNIEWEKKLSAQSDIIAAASASFMQQKQAESVTPTVSAVSFKLPTETEMIDAVAIYLAKRVKQEAVMWFFETIQKNARQYDLIKVFFPNTITLLQSNEVYEIPNLGAQWRYALSKDFVQMPRNVFTSTWFSGWFDSLKLNKDVDIRSFLVAINEVCNLLTQRYNYSQLVKQMYLNLNNKEKKVYGLSVKTIFSVLYAFDQECFLPVDSSTAKRRPLGYEDLRNLNREELETLVSLLDMKYDQSFSVIWRQQNAGLFLQTASDVEQLRKWAGSIAAGIEQFKTLQTAYINMDNAIKDGKKIDAVYSTFNIWDNVNGLINLVIPDTLLNNRRFDTLKAQVKAMKSGVAQVFEIYQQLSLKNYAGAVNTTIGLIEEILYSGNRFKLYMPSYIALKKIEAKDQIHLDGIKPNDTLQFAQTSTVSAFVFEKDRHAINLIRRLGGFLNDVMLTTESKQLSRVVESYALPPGSYKRKRNSWWSIDLNAFAGAYIGGERSNGDDNKIAGVFGITAPIGLTFSHTFGKRLKVENSLDYDLVRNPDKVFVGKKHFWKRSNTTFSLSLNIVDLGAVVAYRMDSDSLSKGLPQQVTWAQVISPGVLLSWGIPTTPLVASFGYQYAPQLRQMKPGQDKLSNTSRFTFSILFDLPLANLLQQSYRKGRY